MSHILTIDIGNTAMKLSVFDDDSMVASIAGAEVSAESVGAFLRTHAVSGISCCRVGQDKEGIVDLVRKLAPVPFLELDSETRVPVEVDYRRDTLGPDRLAAAVGVAAPDKTVLLVDAGTAMTLELTRGLKYAGGNISPGLRLRFRSLNSFTARLPMVGPDGAAPAFGHETHQAIRAGVLKGLAYEVKGAWDYVRSMVPDTMLAVTGGDAEILSKQLTIMNVPHVIDRNAVGRGLVRIFKYNSDYNDSYE